MASFNLNAAGRYPDGTSVTAYSAAGIPTWPGSPPGAGVETVVVTSGVAPFTNLVQGQPYWIADASGKAVRIVAASDESPASGRLTRISDLEALGLTDNQLDDIVDAMELKANKGQPDGYAPLDLNSLIPAQYISVTTTTSFKGLWNASTNTPTLANGIGTNGDMWIAQIAGSVDFGAGSITFGVGDYAIYSGGVWDKLASNSVQSVAGKQGVVTLDKTDVGLSEVNNTADADKPLSTAATTALAGKQPLDADLTAIAALTSAANKMPYATGSGTWTLADLSAFARTILDDADAATVRGTISAQQLDATLTALAALTTAANKLIYATGSDTFATTDLTAFARTILDDADAATVRATIGAVGVPLAATDVATSLPGAATGTNLATDLTDLRTENQTLAKRGVSGNTNLQLTDAGKTLDVNTTSPFTVTIPTESGNGGGVTSVAFPVGFYCEVYRVNTNIVTIQGAVAGMIENPVDNASGPVDSVTIPTRYGTASIRKRLSPNTWVVQGNISGA